MAPGERTALMALVVELARAHRMTVLFTEHSMDVVFGFAAARAGAVARPTDCRRRARCPCVPIRAVQAVYLGSEGMTLLALRERQRLVRRGTGRARQPR